MEKNKCMCPFCEHKAKEAEREAKRRALQVMVQQQVGAQMIRDNMFHHKERHKGHYTTESRREA